MSGVKRTCCICNVEADWVRVRMPNREQMNYLCQAHYRSLRQRNPTLAAYYDMVESVDSRRPWPSAESSSTPTGGVNRDLYPPQRQSHRDF
jgi:hypothetical protein